MHKAYSDFVRARIHAAVDAARAASAVSHSGLKGQIREIVVRDLLRPLIPTDTGVGCGQIVSHTGQTSTEHDVILYDKSILPPIVFEQMMGLFPVECVLYAIQVKSKLTLEGIRDAHVAATQLLGFTYSAGSHDPAGRPQDHPVTKAVCAVLAFATDLTASDELARYQRLLAEEAAAGRCGEPAVRALCVAGAGYWYVVGSDWKTWPGTTEYNEVLGFLAGVMNTYKDVAATRRSPRLGYYLI